MQESSLTPKPFKPGAWPHRLGTFALLFASVCIQACGDNKTGSPLPAAPISPVSPSPSTQPATSASAYAEGYRGTVFYVNEGPAAGVRITTQIETVVRSVGSIHYYHRQGPEAITDATGAFIIPGWGEPGLPEGEQWVIIAADQKGATIFPQSTRRLMSPAPGSIAQIGTIRVQRQMIVSMTAPLSLTLSNDNIPIQQDYECDPCARINVELPPGRAARLRARWGSADPLTFGFSRAANSIYDDNVLLGSYKAAGTQGEIDIDIPLQWQAGATAGKVSLQVGLTSGSRARGGFSRPVTLTLGVEPVD